jgi:hypothetical protein
MNAGDHFRPPRAPVADVGVPGKRPVVVTIALMVLWILLVVRALGTIAQFRVMAPIENGYHVAYVAYLLALVLVPAGLYVAIGHRSAVARMLALVVHVFAFASHVYFMSFGADVSYAWMLVPGTVQAIALLALYLPSSNRWFRGGRTG